MRCPSCGAETSVVDSRPTEDAIRRRRKCLTCNHRFTTWERAADARPSGLAEASRQLREVLQRVPALMVTLEGALDMLDPPAAVRGRPITEDKLGSQPLSRCACGAMVAEKDAAEHAGHGKAVCGSCQTPLLAGRLLTNYCSHACADKAGVMP